MSTPARDAPPMPPKNDSGTEMTSAQGHDTTRKVKPRRIQSLHGPMPRRGGRTASASAASTMDDGRVDAGEARDEALGARLLVACVLDELEDAADRGFTERGLVVRMRKSPDMFTQPEMTSAPAST